MKLKYLIPIIGLIHIYNDIPHYEFERSWKPLQGDEMFYTMLTSLVSTALAIGLFCWAVFN